MVFILIVWDLLVDQLFLLGDPDLIRQSKGSFDNTLYQFFKVSVLHKCLFILILTEFFHKIVYFNLRILIHQAFCKM